MRLEQKVAIVAGAGSGFGEDIARRFAMEVSALARSAAAEERRSASLR